jgi:arylsulfatase A-like enzyme
MKKPKNILFVMVDDLNLSLGCYGHPAVKTPNLDRLAAHGLRFSQAFCTYPLCGPSRSALLTGQRPENLPMADNEVCWRDLRPELQTLPEIARSHGMHTERIGKIFHHGISKDNPVDHSAEGFVLPHTHTDPKSWVCEWGGSYTLDEQNAQGPEQLIDGARLGGTSLHTIRVTNPVVLPDTVIADRATAFLGSPEAREKPFFLGVGFQKPHAPLIAPEKWWAYYDSLDVDAIVPPTFFKSAELPMGTLKDKRFHRGANEDERRHLYKGYLACVSHMDEQLGRVLDALDKNDMAGETLVVFLPDHGYHIGEQGQWDKLMLLDPSLRVPWIMAGPGIPSGRTCDAVVESIDVFPTVCSLMGWSAGQEIAGKNLTPWIEDPFKPSDGAAFAWIKVGKREGWTIRTATHRFGLVSWESAKPQHFLFDLAKDPHEAVNIAGTESQKVIEDSLRLRLVEHFKIPA